MLPQARVNSKQGWHQRSVQLRIWRFDQSTNVRKFKRRSCQLCQLTGSEHILPMLEVTGIHPGCLLKETQRSKHSRKHSRFSTRLSWSVHGDLDCLVVGGHEDGVSVDGNRNGKAFASSGSSNESKIAEFCDLKEDNLIFLKLLRI